MHSNVPWYADSTKELKARATQIIGETLCDDLPVVSQSSRPRKLLTSDTLGDAGSLMNRKRKKKKEFSKHQESQLALVNAWRDRFNSQNFDFGSFASMNRSLRSLSDSIGGSLRNSISVPKPLPDLSIWAVLFRDGMNIGSADAVAQKLRERCVPDVIISSAATDFLGQIIESTARTTIGWTAYVEYTNHFFQCIPDGIFALTSTQCVTNELHEENYYVVRSVYKYRGTLVRSGDVSEGLAEGDVSDAFSIATNEEEESLSIALDNACEDNEGCKRIRTGLESMMPSSGLESITVLPETVFQEDGLPDLSLAEESALFLSSDLLTDLPVDHSTFLRDGSGAAGNTILNQEKELLKSNDCPTGQLLSLAGEISTTSSVSGSKKHLILKPKTIPKVHDANAHNFVADRTLDVMERFYFEAASPKLSNLNENIGDDWGSDSGAHSSVPSSTTGSSAIAIIDCIGAFNVYLNRSMLVEKLEFVYRSVS